MSDKTAQLLLTALLLAAAALFVYLDARELAIALVGAVLGQTASRGVRQATNGKDK